MATEDEIELARKHAYDQGYEHGRDATAGKLISDLVESRDHADDCDCQTCGTRRWICGGKSPGATLADRVREDYEQKREDKEGEL